MILVTGAGGFIGAHLLKRLAVLPLPVRVCSRGDADDGRLRRIAGSIRRVPSGETASLQRAMQGVEQVIHLAGIFRENRRESFESVHQEGTRRLMDAARAAKVRHVVYVSTLGAAPDRIYPFVRSKWLGEEEVRKSGLPFTILRPSLLFGGGDHFLTPLSRVLKSSPYAVIPGFEPLRCQPLWVGDFVSCLVKTVERGVGKGETITLAGPSQISYEGVVDLVQQALGTGRPKVQVPFSCAALVTLLLERVMTSPPATTGILDIWRLGAITARDTVQAAFGVTPMPLAEGVCYLRTSGGPPVRRRRGRERMVTPNRSI